LGRRVSAAIVRETSTGIQMLTELLATAMNTTWTTVASSVCGTRYDWKVGILVRVHVSVMCHEQPVGEAPDRRQRLERRGCIRQDRPWSSRLPVLCHVGRIPGDAQNALGSIDED
jgi:hypothetical protein